MIKKISISILTFLCYLNVAQAAQPTYQQDFQEGTWSTFHYKDNNSQKITSCFALSNDLKLGIKSNNEGVGLLIWDKQGKQTPNTNKKVAITIGKQHFIFTMKAMDENMLMNRLEKNDFKLLLQALSYGQIILVEYGQNPIDFIDLSGIPDVLTKFHECVLKAGFPDYK